jgi:cytochrome bd ubiquinol oxidase subunit II
MIMFWVAVLAVSTLLYVLLDGFDLGVGMLYGLARGEEQRRAMLGAVWPIWDGNETWLVVTGVVLWGAFPVVYATLLSAFYLPLLVMLAGLILRGVAFEFRSKAARARRIWDWSFAGGSLAATFIQGKSAPSSKAFQSRRVNMQAAILDGSVRLPRSAASGCA